MSLDYEDKMRIFKALSDQNRLEIIEILSCNEKCACEILKNFDITQPTLSHHMKVLMDCGYIYEGKEPPLICPVCSYLQEYYMDFSTKEYE